MKVSNWLSSFVRHTRTGDRKYRNCKISITHNGFSFKDLDNNSFQEIEATDDEIQEMLNELKRIKNLVAE